jgi:hypothetical protein
MHPAKKNIDRVAKRDTISARYDIITVKAVRMGRNASASTTVLEEGLISGPAMLCETSQTRRRP